MVDFIRDSDDWTPRRLHGRPDRDANEDLFFNQWKLTEEGIAVDGENGVRRTRGQPATLQRIVEVYHKDIFALSGAPTGLSEQLLAAVVATESGGKADAERFEEHLGDYSIGLMQTLTATAKQLMAQGGNLPQLSAPPIPNGGALETWRGFLREPQNSLALGAAYLRHQNRALELNSDPILLYCAYNAGSVRKTSKNSWGLVSYGHALDHFSRFYGDACAVYGARP